MKHLTFAEQSLLIGDEAADVLLRYAKALADQGRADTVTFRVIGRDGNEVDIDMLLDGGTIMAAESTNTTATAPDNTERIADVRERLRRFEAPSHVTSNDELRTGIVEFLDDF